MNKFLIPLIVLSLTSFAGAADATKNPAPVSTSPAPSKPSVPAGKTTAEKIAASQAYLNKMVGDWEGENKYMAPSGTTVTSMVTESYKWVEKSGVRVLAFTGTNRFRMGMEPKNSGVYSITDSGDILFEFSEEGESRHTYPARVVAGNLVMRADAKGDVNFYSSEEFVKEGIHESRKGMGFSLVTLPGNAPAKVRFSFTRKRRS